MIAGAQTVAANDGPASRSGGGTVSPEILNRGKRKGDDVLIAGVQTVLSNDDTTLNSTDLRGGRAAVNLFPTSTAPSPLTTNTLFTNTMHSTTSSGNGGYTAVVYDHSEPSWLDSASLDHKLYVVRQSLKLDPSAGHNADEDDVFIKDVRQCQANMQAFRQQQQDMMELSNLIKDGLKVKISEQEEKCQEESQDVAGLERVLEEIKQERDSIANDIVDLETTRQKLQQCIAKALEEANQQVEAIDMVEEARKNEVPKIKREIALFANTTGIKWDYENDHLLEGHVVRMLWIAPCNIILIS